MRRISCLFGGMSCDVVRQVSALEVLRSGQGATVEEVGEMQAVLEAWQVQAASAQQELVRVSERLREVSVYRWLARGRWRLRGGEEVIGLFRGRNEIVAARRRRQCSHSDSPPSQTPWVTFVSP